MSEKQVQAALRKEWEELMARSRSTAFVTGPPTPISLFAELEEVGQGWEKLRESELLPRVAGRSVNSGWTLRELLAHLASWAKEFRLEIETSLAGGSFDYAIPYAFSVMGPNAWNQKEVESRRPTALAEIFAELESETRRLQDVVVGASKEELLRSHLYPLAPSGSAEERWQGTPAQIVLAKCMHDRYHLGQIERFLGSVRSDES